MKREVILSLRLIAAQAEKLASDLETNRLWEGDYQKALGTLQRTLNAMPDERSFRP